jgi:hypothetical protein
MNSMYVSKLSWQQNSVKPSGTDSHVRQFKYMNVPDAVSISTIRVLMMDTESWIQTT